MKNMIPPTVLAHFIDVAKQAISIFSFQLLLFTIRWWDFGMQAVILCISWYRRRNDYLYNWMFVIVYANVSASVSVFNMCAFQSISTILCRYFLWECIKSHCKQANNKNKELSVSLSILFAFYKRPVMLSLLLSVPSLISTVAKSVGNRYGISLCVCDAIRMVIRMFAS